MWWGILDKKTNKFTRFFNKYTYENKTYDVFELFLFPTENEAIKKIEYWKKLSKFQLIHSRYEPKELPQNEPRYVLCNSNL